MILAVLSFLLRPLNAVSSVLLKTHSRFLIYSSSSSSFTCSALVSTEDSFNEFVLCIVIRCVQCFSFVLFFVVSAHQDPPLESD